MRSGGSVGDLPMVTQDRSNSRETSAGIQAQYIKRNKNHREEPRKIIFHHYRLILFVCLSIKKEVINTSCSCHGVSVRIKYYYNKASSTVIDTLTGTGPHLIDHRSII